MSSAHHGECSYVVFGGGHVLEQIALEDAK